MRFREKAYFELCKKCGKHGSIVCPNGSFAQIRSVLDGIKALKLFISTGHIDQAVADDIFDAIKTSNLPIKEPGARADLSIDADFLAGKIPEELLESTCTPSALGNTTVH